MRLACEVRGPLFFCGTGIADDTRQSRMEQQILSGKEKFVSFRRRRARFN